ncbi:MAG: hypothetical protein O3C40_13445 [Planctomycetota bacterium]|nr:hypothetical protein [Planctomycetota bacterium]
MKIVVNHLTRMQQGFMCVAGIDLQTGRHVRPVLNSQMRTKFLACHGGPFEMGTIVDLGWTKSVGRPPAIEDVLFHRSEVQPVGDMPPDEFWRLLDQTAQPKLVAIFGSGLKPRGRGSYGVEQNQGDTSLGCYRLPNRARLFIQHRGGDRRGRIRIEFQFGEYPFDLGVTDVRLYAVDHVTPQEDLVQQANQRLQTDDEVILSVGLSRPFQSNEGREPIHWLQVNNLHFAAHPGWRLA